MLSSDPDGGRRNASAAANNSVHSRLCVLEQRFDDHVGDHKEDDDKRDARIAELERQLKELDKSLEVFKTKVAAYAGIGAVAGSILVNLVADWLSRVLKP